MSIVRTTNIHLIKWNKGYAAFNKDKVTWQTLACPDIFLFLWGVGSIISCLFVLLEH